MKINAKKYMELSFVELILILISFFMPIQTSIANFTDGELPSDVRDQLQKNGVAMSAIHLDYTDTWIRTNNEVLTTTHFECYDAGRVYQRCQGVFPNLEPWIQDYSFDGKLVWSGTPDIKSKEARGCPARLMKMKAGDSADRNDSVNSFQPIYLDCAGLYAPKSMADISQSSSIESLVLRYLRESESTKVEKTGENLRVTVKITDPVLAGARQINREKEIAFFKNVGSMSDEDIRQQIEVLKKMQELAPTRSIAFVLDPKRGYGVVEREEWTAAGQRILHIQSNQWKYHQSTDIWLPDQYIISYYTDPQVLLEFSDNPLATTAVQLQNVDFGPQQNVEFNLAERSDYKKPGTCLIDVATPEARARPDHQMVYIIAADGTQLRESVGNASHEMSRGKRIFWLCLLLITFGSPLAVFFIKRKC